MPLATRYRDHVGELGFWQGTGRVQAGDVLGFGLSGDYCLNRAGESGNFRKSFF